MTKFFKIFTIFASLVITALTTISLPAHALPNTNSNRYIVTATKGLNVRDNNCKITGSVGYGYWIAQNSPKEITCNINGVSQKLINASGMGGLENDYIAIKYLAPINQNNSISAQDTSLKVNAKGGLNLRNGDCKRVTTIPNNTRVSIYPNADNTVCKVGNKYYDMVPVIYNNVPGYVASIYLTK